MTSIFRRLRNMKGVGIFADHDSKNAPPEFLRFNLVYGFNGSGKSTLARVFASLQLGTPPPTGEFLLEMDDKTLYGTPDKFVGLEKRVCVFDADFISRHFKWAEGKANSIFYISEEQAEAARQLEQAERKLPTARSALQIAMKSAKERNNSFGAYKRSAAKPLHAALHLGNRKYEAPNLQQDYERLSYSEENRLTKERLEAFEKIADREAPPPPLGSATIDGNALAETFERARGHAEAEIGEVIVEDLQQHPEMVNWARTGHEYHEEHRLHSCLYCGQELSAARRALLAAAFDGALSSFIKEVSNARTKLGAAIEAIVEVRKTLPQVEVIEHSLQSQYKDALGSITQALEPLRHLAREAMRIYAERESKPTSSVAHALPDAVEISTICGRLVGGYATAEKIIKTHNEINADFVKHQSEAREAIKKHFLISGHDEFTRHRATAVKAEKEVASAEALLKGLLTEIEGLHKRVRTHGPAATTISKLVAAYLGHGELTIAAAAEGYELHRHGRLVKGPPSEGEKTAIALCYFLTTLQEDGRKLADLIVVIDDPISSLDTKAMNYACNLILSYLHNVGQLIVLTHNQHCMNEVRKAWKPLWDPRSDKTPPTAKLLYIDVRLPEGGSRTSALVDMPKLLRAYDSEYHFLCQKLFELEGARDAHYDYGFLMPHIMRRVLEVFLGFKRPGSGPIKDKLASMCEEHKNLDRTRIGALERLSQVESHSDNIEDLVSHSSMTVEESRDANSALLHLMTTADKTHTEEMRKQCRKK
jgi:wobble nucleotide-excising tRNase